MKTNVYHITHTPELKEAEIFFWGCNMECRGCLCKKTIWDFLIPENLPVRLEETPKETAKPPQRFLELEEVLQILDKLDFKQITIGGMEPTFDPNYSLITKTLRERYGSYNVVFTNLLEKPPFEDTDMIILGLNTVNDNLHREYTGISNVRILENLVQVFESGKKLAVGLLFIPDYIDKEEIERSAKFIAGLDKDIPCFVRPYVQAGDGLWRRANRDEIDKVVAVAKKYLSKVNYLYGDEEVKYRVESVFPDTSTLREIINRGSQDNG